jgi:hypothetical protein
MPSWCFIEDVERPALERTALDTAVYSVSGSSSHNQGFRVQAALIRRLMATGLIHGDFVVASGEVEGQLPAGNLFFRDGR